MLAIGLIHCSNLRPSHEKWSWSGHLCSSKLFPYRYTTQGVQSCEKQQTYVLEGYFRIHELFFFSSKKKHRKSFSVLRRMWEPKIGLDSDPYPIHSFPGCFRDWVGFATLSGLFCGCGVHCSKTTMKQHYLTNYHTTGILKYPSLKTFNEWNLSKWMQCHKHTRTKKNNRTMNFTHLESNKQHAREQMVFPSRF